MTFLMSFCIKPAKLKKMGCIWKLSDTAFAILGNFLGVCVYLCVCVWACVSVDLSGECLCVFCGCLGVSLCMNVGCIISSGVVHRYTLYIHGLNSSTKLCSAQHTPVKPSSIELTFHWHLFKSTVDMFLLALRQT